MAEENVVVVRFTELSNAHQALSVLKDVTPWPHRTGVRGGRGTHGGGRAAYRGEHRQLRPLGAAGGSLIGMLVGVLGGPLGVLLGWGAGAMIGMASTSIRSRPPMRRSSFSAGRFRRSRPP